MAQSFFESNTVVMAIVPVDLQTAANTGDWVSMENYESCVVMLIKGIGTAGDDPVFNLQQASDNAGTGAKDINFTVIYQKVGATAINAVTDFTRTTQTAATSYTNAASAENEAIIAVQIDAQDLDVDGGFTHLRLDVADVGSNAQIGGAIYLMLGAKHAQATPPGAIA